MNVGFTGTRSLGKVSDTRRERLKTVLAEWYEEGAMFHHGDCVGADEYAHRLAVELGYQVTLHPPLNSSQRAYCVADHKRSPFDYIARNHEIVKAADVMVALPEDPAVEVLHSGTWARGAAGSGVGRLSWPIYN